LFSSGVKPVQELKVSVAAARRVLLARQGLLAAAATRPWRDELSGPTGTLQAVERLGVVQLDPVAVVERTHHLTLHARVKGYKTAWFDGLFAKGALFEYLANARCALPMTALPDFWPIMHQARLNAAEAREHLAHSVAEVMEAAHRQKEVRPREVGNEGPRLMGIGYNAPDEGSKASGRAIDLLWLGGQLFVSRREGAEKWYALPEKVLPPAIRAQIEALEPEGLGPGSAARARLWATPAVRKGVAPWTDMLARRYLEAFTLADLSDFRFGWQQLASAERKAVVEAAAERGEAVPVRIEGIKRLYWAPASAAEALEGAEASPDAWEPEPEVRFLPPLDNLLWHRPRLADLFGFDYTWEVYIPPAKRRYGAYTMPILEGDRLIGRIDPRMDRAKERLVLQLVQLEPGVKPDRSRLSRLARGLRAFAKFHGAKEIEVLRTEPEGLRIPV
jgi:uncharacterized protein YcaQ